MTEKLREIKEVTPLEEIAEFWSVTPKTIKNWCEFVYQAFNVALPPTDIPRHGVEMLTIAAKHISPQASRYFQETGEKRRLKGSEFIAKIRRLREQEQFQDYQQFQNFQNFQPNPTETSIDDEDNLLADLGETAREEDEMFSQMRTAIEQRENQQVEEFAQFIDNSSKRKLQKLQAQLTARKALREVTPGSQPQLGAVINTVTAIAQRVE